MVKFWEKLGIGLKKSSDLLSAGLADIFTKKKLDQDTLNELEDLLISSDFGISTSATLIAELAAQKLDKEISESEVKKILAQKIAAILKPCEQSFPLDSSKKPYVILMVGVNGAGKTTTIGKLAVKMQQQGKQVSFIAADTFRAAAVEQLKIWGERANIRVFSGANGCDSAGLCYDGLNAAVKNGDDIVFIDTAGRLQNKAGLMAELQKIVKVIQKIMPDAPHSTLLTLDATTGQNALSQVEVFNQMIGISGLIITKLDGSSKGGMLVSIAQGHHLPIYYIGVGEHIDDLDTFKANDYATRLLDISE